ncbi:peptide MFS transporter [Nonomuraea sp. NPDC000554]|uniref:peptide MFS transporter n=1 Tax=Nonomuraea sp. NPDC000554 TaxID=3154259 RepID=UPI00332C69BB
MAPSLLPWRQPRWFSTLFMTDLWERFSFFGMMAILFLYATSPGGLAMPPGSAGALVGLYISLTFVASVPGGWLGDRVFGPQRAVLTGAVLIACGHLTLVIPVEPTFYLGIALIAAGTGLLKPNLSALIGAFCPPGQAAEREAAFSVFFVSIQLGALLAPLVTGFVGESVDWHLGFGTAAVGMGVGIAVFARGRKHLGEIGRTPSHPADPATLRRLRLWGSVVSAVVAAGLIAAALNGVLRVELLVAVVGLLVLVAPLPYSRVISKGASAEERVRLRAYAWVFFTTIVLFLLVSQSNSVLNHFAAVSTDRQVGSFLIPASWFNSLHPLFVLLVAPVLARVWSGPAGRLAVPVKLAAGLVIAAVSFLLMVFAVQSPAASPLWLVAVYLTLSTGELIIGTVGLGVTAQVAPPGATSQLMGLWWLAGAVGAVIGGQLARLAMPGAGPGAGGEQGPATAEPLYFLALTILPLLVAAVLVLARARIAARLRPGPKNPSFQLTTDGGPQ